MIVFLEAATYD